MTSYFSPHTVGHVLEGKRLVIDANLLDASNFLNKLTKEERRTKQAGVRLEHYPLFKTIRPVAKSLGSLHISI